MSGEVGVSGLTRVITANAVSQDQVVRCELGQGQIIFHVILTTGRIPDIRAFS